MSDILELAKRDEGRLASSEISPQRAVSGFVPPPPPYTSPPIDWAKMGIESAKTAGAFGASTLPWGTGAIAAPLYRTLIEKTDPYPFPGGAWTGVPIDLATSILPGLKLGLGDALKLAAKTAVGAGVGQFVGGPAAQAVAGKVGEAFTPGLTKDIVTGAIRSLPSIGGAMYGPALLLKLGALVSGKLPSLALKTGIAHQASIPRPVPEGQEAAALLQTVSPEAFGQKAPVIPGLAEKGVMKQTLGELKTPLGEKVGAAKVEAARAMSEGDFLKAKKQILSSLSQSLTGPISDYPIIGKTKIKGKIKFDPTDTENSMAAKVVVDAFEKVRNSKDLRQVFNVLSNLKNTISPAYDSAVRAKILATPIYTSFEQALRGGITQALKDQGAMVPRMAEAAEGLSQANAAFAPAAEISNLISKSFSGGVFKPSTFKGLWMSMTPAKKAQMPELTQQINTVLNAPESEIWKKLKDLFLSASSAIGQRFFMRVPGSPLIAAGQGLSRFEKLQKPPMSRFYAPRPEPGFIRTAASYGPLFMQRLAEERQKGQ